MEVSLRCTRCGALWYSRVAEALSKSGTRCLACTGRLVEEASPDAGHRAGDSDRKADS